MRGWRLAAGLALAATGAMAAAGAVAEPVASAEARKAVWPAKTPLAIVMRPHPNLPPDQANLLSGVASGQPYYGAIAFSPDEGIMVEATVAAVNHHSVEAAEAAALRDCNAKRTGEAVCAVVVVLRPDGWEARPLQLSQAATEALRKEYGRSGPRAMAVSPSTGTYGIGAGDGAGAAAIAACAKAGAEDCTVVVAD
ncbi:MAG: DUF4189 domain-containing protein [Gemmobacter sp.]